MGNSLVTVYKNGKEYDPETFTEYSSLVFVDLGARIGELFPDETGPGVYFKTDESDTYLEVRRDLGSHVDYSYLPFLFQIKQAIFQAAEFHLFEPNPEFIDDLKRKAKYISQRNCIVWIHQAAAGTKLEKTNFKVTDGGWGSTICENKQNETFINEIEVQQIDFLSFIAGLEKRAEFPIDVHIKMDIEGSEYSLLSRLFKNWEHCNSIKSLSVEFHKDFYPKKHDKWIAEHWMPIVSLLKSDIAFNWWPGEW